MLSFDAIAQRAQSAMEKAGRSHEELKILPVSKGQALQHILPFFVDPKFPRILGESYLDELIEKQSSLPSEIDVEWHFLGKLQSRKLKKIFEAVDVVHSVSRLKELEWISENCRKRIPSFYLQVNVSEEKTKGGFSPSELAKVSDVVGELNLTNSLSGLMTLASPLEKVGEKSIRREFSLLRGLRDKSFPNKELNMGMSGDFEIAISEGSNIIRLGSILFGERAPR